MADLEPAADSATRSQPRGAESLPPEIWGQVIRALNPSDIRNLMLTSKMMYELATPSALHDLLFTEFNGEGLRLVEAIERGEVGDHVLSYARVLHIEFSSRTLFEPTLQLLRRMTAKFCNIEKIIVRTHRAGHGIHAANFLIRGYPWAALELHADVCTNSDAVLTLSSQAMAAVTSLSIPVIHRSLLSGMTGLEHLRVDSIIHDTDLPLAHEPESCSISYYDWQQLQSPRIPDLQLRITSKCLESHARPDPGSLPGSLPFLDVRAPGLVKVKLVGDVDMLSRFGIKLEAESLRMLTFYQMPAAAVEMTLQSSNLPNLEFLSLEPASVAALRGCFQSNLQALSLLLAFIMPESFKDAESAEPENLILWLQTVASKFPTDVRDLTGKIESELYFSNGLWCSLSQGAFSGYVSRICP